MQKKHWLHTVISLALVRALVITAYAQEASLPAAAVSNSRTVSAQTSHGRYAGRGGGGFQAQLDRAVGLTPEQRDTIRGLLAQQHQERVAMQEQTDAKIRVLLSPEQQKKFDEFLAQQKQTRGARSYRAS
jgi:Spy/CpxP family protein refolding chaperone